MLNLLEQGESRGMLDVFTRAEYSAEGLARCLGPIQIPTRAGRAFPHLLHLTRRGRPLDILIRLFLIGVPVEAKAACQALDPVPLETWTQAGMLELKDGSALGLVKMMAFRDFVFAVDQTIRPEISVLSEQVMGLTLSTMSLANLAIRRPSRDSLDIGTGCGILALLASRHSEQVYAVDVSARALNFARFNAWLNGCANIHFLEGSVFEPVSAHQFDLILSNPPFVIAPSPRYLYRDSGMRGDQFCRNLIKEAPRFLREGGYCQITCDWLHVSGQDWKEPLAEWFHGSGCDAWVMKLGTHDPAGYADMWIRDTEKDSLDLTARRYEEWVSYFESESIEAINNGVIAMRRANGRPNWLRIEDAPELMSGFVGDYVALGFELGDYLRGMSDERLLDEKLCISPDVRLDQRCEWSEGKWHIASARIQLDRGLEFAGNIDRNGTALISRCDGRRTLRDVIADIAADVKVDAAKITPMSVALVRKLIERGYLLPPGFSASPLK